MKTYHTTQFSSTTQFPVINKTTSAHAFDIQYAVMEGEAQHGGHEWGALSGGSLSYLMITNYIHTTEMSHVIGGSTE